MSMWFSARSSLGLQSLGLRYLGSHVFGLGLLIFLFGSTFSNAQTGFGPAASASSGELLEEVRALQMPVRVLYLAAHPDDENTRMLTWLSKGMRVDAAYLSLTRGDGGQNLIGKETGDELGLIRTYESMGARSLDGARQFFTRANDFGYSKTSEETFQQWHHDSLLSDVVWVIRLFRPHVIITRFTPEPSATHGHHTASAQLAVEAFTAAADPNQFPDQLLRGVDVWSTRTLYWNTSWWFFGRPDFDKKGLEAIDVGGFSPILGRSYGETAALSRSMHRSQGFGSSLQRGEELEYLKWLAGDSFAGGLSALLLDQGRRERGLASRSTYYRTLSDAERAFRIDHPWQMLTKLISARDQLLQLPDNAHRNDDLLRLDRLILKVAGIWHEFTSPKHNAHPGDTLVMSFRTIRRHPVVVRLDSIQWQTQGGQVGGMAANEPEWQTNRGALAVDTFLPYNRFVIRNQRVRLPDNVPLSHPFWLQGRVGRTGFFDFPGQAWAGVPTDPAAVRAMANYTIFSGKRKVCIHVPVDVLHRYTDPAEGERYRPFTVVPPLYLSFVDPIALHTGPGPIQVGVRVSSGADIGELDVRLDLPPGWMVEPYQHTLPVLGAGESRILRFVVNANDNPTTGIARVRARIGNQEFSRNQQVLSYPHLPQLNMLPEAGIPILHAEVNRIRTKIAYVPGTGDEIPAALRALGYEVTEHPAGQWTPEELSDHQAVVLGVRLVNTDEEYRKLYPMLRNFAHNGGTVLMQYQTSRGLLSDSLAPFLMQLGSQRTTVEEASVRILMPDHPLLNYPNKLGVGDFMGWVQERGLYYAARWDSSSADALFAMADPGEAEQYGALIVGRVGRGWWIYTGLSLFRQLPAGIPGAFRLLSSCVELGSGRVPQQRREDNQ